MTIKVLNNVDHKDLKVDARPNRRYKDFVNRTAVLTTEYGDLHKTFPILFSKDGESGSWTGHAILGFDKDENLFIQDNEWQTEFVPAALARGPFSIGYRRGEEGEDPMVEPMIMVDEDDARCGVEDGEAVFLEFGGESPYLEYIKKVLHTIDNGLKIDKVFFDLLLEFELLEPVSIDVTLSDTRQVNFSDYHTISQDRLAVLDGEALQKLNSAGALAPIYFAISSLGNFRQLISRKNARSATA